MFCVCDFYHPCFLGQSRSPCHSWIWGQVAGLLTYMKRRMLEQEAKVAADFGEGKSGHLGSTAAMHDIEDLLVVATLSKRSCLALSGTPSSSLSSVLPQRHCSSFGRTHTPT